MRTVIADTTTVTLSRDACRYRWYNYSNFTSWCVPLSRYNYSNVTS